MNYSSSRVQRGIVHFGQRAPSLAACSSRVGDPRRRRLRVAQRAAEHHAHRRAAREDSYRHRAAHRVPARRASDRQRRVQRRQSTQVLSPVSGPATRVVAAPGMAVHKGDPLAFVSSPDFASAVADYRKAQTAYRNAKRIADRDSALFKNDALARGDLEQAQADVASAEADLDAAIQNMRALGVDESQIDAVRDGKTTAIEAIVRAPIDGTVVEKLIADGQLLQAGTTPVLHDRRSEHDVGHGERVRERFAGRRAWASRSTSSPTRAAPRFRARSTTSRRSPIRARRR